MSKSVAAVGDSRKLNVSLIETSQYFWRIHRGDRLYLIFLIPILVFAEGASHIYWIFDTIKRACKHQSP